MLQLLKEVLVHHPLVLAMKASIGREKGRDRNKHEVVDTVRIPLPIKVMHSPATETDDSFFSGVEFITKVDGSSYMTFHMIGEMKDGYSPMRTPLQQHSSPARPSSITSRFSAPPSPVVIGGPLSGGGDASGFASRLTSVVDDDDDDEDFTYHSQGDTVLDADTYGDLGSVSTMFTDQWADQNPGGSMVSDRKPSKRRP
jgi:hypothetical protein